MTSQRGRVVIDYHLPRPKPSSTTDPRRGVFGGPLGPICGLDHAWGPLATLVIGVWHVQAGMLTVGRLLVLMAHLAQIAAFIEAMERLMQGRTTFMIAHRLRTLETATCESSWLQAGYPLSNADKCRELGLLDHSEADTAPDLNVAALAN